MLASVPTDGTLSDPVAALYEDVIYHLERVALIELAGTASTGNRIESCYGQGVIE